MEILPGIHQIPGVVANPYLLVEPAGLTLIDTGLPRSERKIQRYIADLGYSLADLRWILVTHADVDHTGGLAYLKKNSAAEVASSAIEAQAIARGEMSRPLKLRGVQKWFFSLVNALVSARPADVDRLLSPTDELPQLGGLKVLDTRGHTPGHLSFYAENQRILFAGDSLRSRPDRLSPSTGMNTWDEDLALQAMARQADLAPEIVCVGHGPVVRSAAGKFPLIP